MDKKLYFPNNSQVIKTEHFCSICKANKPLSDLLFIKTCSHYFCTKCTSNYVSAHVLENIAVITCAIPDCKVGIFEPQLCKPMISKDIFDHWCLSLCVFAIEKKFYCPFKDCFALLSDERDDHEMIWEAECPHCHRLFCAQCESAWHGKESCDQVKKLGSNF